MNTNVRIVVSSPWKRKRPEDADVYYNRIPRRGPFHEMISGAKDAQKDPSERTHTRPCAEPQLTTTTLSPIERLPYETFLHIASYLGPTASLAAMARVNRRYDRFLRRIGDIMLHKARRCFRNPLHVSLLPLASPNTSGTIIGTLRKESSISIFVRYSSHCSHIHSRLEILRNLLLLGDGNKDACGTRQDYDDDKRPAKRFRKTTATAATIRHDSVRGVATLACSTQPSISSHNVDEALDVATGLVTELSNSLSFPGHHHHLACSYALEARILAMAGKVGGVVYKHSKGTLELLEHEMFLGNGPVGDGDDVIAYCEEDNNSSSPDDGASKEIRKQISLDVVRIDRARVLMQRVMFHKLLLENK